MKEGDLVDIVSESGEFLARGYYGLQNKGSAGRLPAINMNRLTKPFSQQINKSGPSARQTI